MDVPSLRSARRTWEAIAASFDATRRRPWTPVVRFLEALPSRARLLDAGTGNGRHAAVAAAHGLAVVGVDLSRNLLRAARERTPAARFVQGVLEALPIRGSSFDAILCAAALHHVRGRAHRRGALAELRRCAGAGGVFLVTVWARDQPRFSHVEPPEPHLRLPTEPGDARVAWTHGGLHEARFVHLYTQEELQADLVAAGWRVERSWSEALGGPAPDNHLALANVEGSNGVETKPS